MAEVTQAMRAACKWLRERGGSAAIANVKGGGRVYLAAGEHGPFLPVTARALVHAGLAKFEIVNGKPRRLTLTEPS